MPGVAVESISSRLHNQREGHESGGSVGVVPERNVTSVPEYWFLIGREPNLSH